MEKSKFIELSESSNSINWDIFWLWIEAREIYENIKNIVKNLIHNK